jgi:5-methyltetrahydrofolate--homocysteine methyltransferase
MTENPLYIAVLDGDARGARAAVEEALNAGADPQDLLSSYMIPAMDEVGKRFDDGEYFVPELLIAARAMKSGLELLRPLLAETGAKPVGTVIVGTVRGDLHDIGKNLVASMLEGGGFKVIDLGVDVAPEKFTAAINEYHPDILAMSALLTTTMPGMKSTIDVLKQEGLRDCVKIMIGGAPVTRRYAAEIGADAFSESASGAVREAKSLLNR